MARKPPIRPSASRIPVFGSSMSTDHEEALSDNIFIVHGRDGPAKTEVARFIETAGLRAIILHEQANAGRTIIEKFEAHGGEAGFAVVLLTPDDVGARAPMTSSRGHVRTSLARCFGLREG